jgi:hypothetical protein
MLRRTILDTYSNVQYSTTLKTESENSGKKKNNKTGSELMCLLPKLKRLSVSKLVPDPVLSRFRP